MRFEKFIPTDQLKPYIKYFVVSENELENEYKVFPSSGLVIGFQYKGQLATINNNTESKLTSAGITDGYDGHIDYHGADNYTAKVPAKYDALSIADTSKGEEFKAELVAHQQGKTDFLTFIKMCATFGIEKWAICMEKMIYTYYDKAGNEILIEQIPQ